MPMPDCATCLDRTRKLLRDLQPMLYGICIKEYGAPENWPKDRACVIYYRRLCEELDLPHCIGKE